MNLFKVTRCLRYQHDMMPDWWPNPPIRIHVGNQLYDIDHIDTVIDMDTNKPNIVIHVKDK